MASIPQHDPKRKLVLLAQQGTCLLCAHPLIFGCHLHHVIASDDKGPDHPLNLIGLCANHHTVLECVPRHVSPKETYKNHGWLQRAQAAIKVIETLSEEQQRLFNDLAEPHPLRKEMREGVEPKWRLALAGDIARADSQLLLRINKARPGIALLWQISRGEAPEPKTDDEWAAAVGGIGKTLRPVDFREVVAMHLSALDLPFKRGWLENEAKGDSQLTSG